jgi:hypothetical protein
LHDIFKKDLSSEFFIPTFLCLDKIPQQQQQQQQQATSIDDEEEILYIKKVIRGG